MKQPATRKDFLREIYKSRGRFLSILFIVALGVAFFSGLRSARPSMEMTGDAYFDAHNLMDLSIVSPQGITKESLEEIEKIPGVKRAEGGFSGDFLGKKGKEHLVVRVTALNRRFNTPEVTKGRLPENSSECFADKKLGYDIGDEIALESGSQMPVESVLKEKKVRVTGIGNSPCYISEERGSTGIGSGSIDGFLLVPEESFILPSYTQVYVEAEKAREKTAYTKAYEDEIKKVKKEIEDRLEEKEGTWYVQDRNALPEYEGFGDNARRMGAIAQVFPAIFFLVAALISLTGMTRMVEEQRTTIGTMKALGYGELRISAKYWKYALYATVTGSVIGVLAGEKFFPYIIIHSYRILYPGMRRILIPYHWEYGALATGLALFCTLGATLLACHKELREQPAQLMRPEAPKNGTRIFLERLPLLWSRMNFTWKSAMRNLFRYKKRFFMTVAGIGGCMGLMLVGFGLRDSIVEVSNVQYKKLQTYDGSLYFGGGTTEEKKAFLEEMKKQEEVKTCFEVYVHKVTLKRSGKSVEAYLMVMPEKEYKEAVCLRNRKTGKAFDLEEGAVLTEKASLLLKQRKTKELLLKDKKHKDRKIKIRNTAENYMGHYLYMNEETYRNLYGETPDYNSIVFVAKKGVSQSRLESLGEEWLKNPQVQGISYMDEAKERLQDMIRSLNLVMGVLIMAAGALSFIVLYNLNTINITERQREMATLKVLGFYDREVSAYVYRENVILTLFGAIFGAGVGTLLHQFMIRTVETDVTMFGRLILPGSYLYSFLLTILFSLLVNGAMYWKLKKIDMIESLKSVE